MRRAGIITAAAAVFAIGGQCRANLLPVNSNTVVQDGIEYYIETDKIVYDLGEDVAFVYRISNLTDEEWEVRWLGLGADIVIEAKEEGFREVWAWSWGIATDGGPKRLVLQAGESAEILDVWPQVDYRGTGKLDDDMPAIPGTYRVTGSFLPTETSFAVEISVVPEPTSIIFLCGGIAFVRFKRRMP
jgi:hypothetical protein